MRKRQNPTYIDFLQEVIDYHYDVLSPADFENITEKKCYYRDRDAFKS